MKRRTAWKTQTSYKLFHCFCSWKQWADFSKWMLLFSVLSSNKGMRRQSAFCLPLTSLPGLDSRLQVGKSKQVTVIIVTAPLWTVFTADWCSSSLFHFESFHFPRQDKGCAPHILGYNGLAFWSKEDTHFAEDKSTCEMYHKKTFCKVNVFPRE